MLIVMNNIITRMRWRHTAINLFPLNSHKTFIIYTLYYMSKKLMVLFEMIYLRISSINHHLVDAHKRAFSISQCWFLCWMMQSNFFIPHSSIMLRVTKFIYDAIADTCYIDGWNCRKSHKMICYLFAFLLPFFAISHHQVEMIYLNH